MIDLKRVNDQLLRQFGLGAQPRLNFRSLSAAGQKVANASQVNP